MNKEATLGEFGENTESEQNNKWREVRLDDVSKKRSENVDPQEVELDRHIGLEHIHPNTPYPNWESLDHLSSTKRRFEAGDVLFAKLRPNLEKSAQPDFDGVSSTDIFPIVAEDGLNSKFLLYRLSSKPAYDFARRTSAGTRMPRTSWNLFSNFEFGLPSTKEQRKIATVLYTVDRAIKYTESIIGHYENLQTGLLRKHFGKDSVQANYPEDRETKRLGPKSYTVPKNWQTVQIADVGEVVTGDRPSTKNEDYYGGELTFVTPEDFGESKRVYQGSRGLTDEGRQKSRPIPEDSVMMDCIGMDMGKVKIAGQELATNQQINSVIVNTEKMLPEFLYFHLKAISNLIQSQAGQTRTPIVSKSQFSSFDIFCPPLPAQKDVVNSLSVFDDLIKNESAYKTQLHRLKRGLMQDLLSGSVRTTDTNITVPDEVAQYG